MLGEEENYEFDLGLTRENIFHLLQPSCVPTNLSQQCWLQRGFVWYYAFNHEEAIFCFNKALMLNQECPMAHYGISLCHGPNYNTRYMTRDDFPSAEVAYNSGKKANELILIPSIREGHSEVEIALIEALSCRYNPVDPSTTQNQIDHNIVEFIAAMAVVYAKYPDHACVACLYVEALLNTNPWKHWDLSTGQPSPSAQLAQQILEVSLVAHPNHPGLNHFNIHLLEMSPFPEAALQSCEILRFHCSPDLGHLIHMPSHIYVLLGLYDEAAQANIEAIRADNKYQLKAGNLNYYTGYRIHNIHFVSYAAMFAGQFSLCLYLSLSL
jgi:tetratricopeptide (TPR) repeat protein